MYELQMKTYPVHHMSDDYLGAKGEARITNYHSESVCGEYVLIKLRISVCIRRPWINVTNINEILRGEAILFLSITDAKFKSNLCSMESW